MPTLEAVLDNMNRINQEMRNVVHREDADRSQRIVSLRQEFSAQTGNLIHHLPVDERLRYNPALFHEFQDRLALVRRKLANHQAQWSLQDITLQRDSYLDACETVHGNIADYLDWAKGELRPH